ncbi:MAG: exostosin family protein [Pseudomonadota bacterium]
MKIHLYTPYYRSQDDNRHAELDRCLEANVANPLIEQITLFVDDGHVPPMSDDKLRVVDIDGRVTYRDWVEYAVSRDDRHIAILSNTDIFFDETIWKLNTVFRAPNRFVALSRHEDTSSGLVPHPNPQWSQDVWAIDTGSELPEGLVKALDFGLGVPRCDNKVVFEAIVHGADVVNPFPDVHAIHVHESQVRQYHKTLDRTLVGGMGFAAPSETLHAPSKVELSVWPRKATNVEGLKLVDALQVWERQDAETISRSIGVAAYDQLWQYPAITEKCAFENISSRRHAIPDDVLYFAFPWATLIDKLLNRPGEAKSLLHNMRNVSAAAKGKRRVVTVCQHIHLLKFQQVFADAGVTDIFWSHKTNEHDYCPEHPGIRLHPFPLYPVQCPSTEIEQVGERSLLFSFVGAKAKPFYLTQVRTYILEELAEHRRGRVVGRNDWHYNKIVYDHQILGKAASADNLVDDRAGEEFVQGLRESLFSLCPSGSGPNSIRLWESIAAGCIPVILADSHELPGDRRLWEQAVVFCEETREAVRALPDRLELLASDDGAIARMRLALKQLWMLYNPSVFTYDVERYLASDGAQADAYSVEKLLFSDHELIELSRLILDPNKPSVDAEYMLLSSVSMRGVIDPVGFARTYARQKVLRHAVDAAAKRRPDAESTKAWKRAEPLVKKEVNLLGPRRGERVPRLFVTGRSANRLPLNYEPYRGLAEHRFEFVNKEADADLIIVAASDNLREYYEQALCRRSDFSGDKLVVLSEEPLWDTTWGFEFDRRMGSGKVKNHQYSFAVLNHFTSDIFKFHKIPYFVTTRGDYAVRYANLFRRNTSMTPTDLLEMWERAPIRQAYFAEKREHERYDFMRPDLDLYGHCGFRTRIAEQAPEEGLLVVGQGWGDAPRRQELADWHLDKLAQLDRQTYIASALENTHYPDYITEKPFDAFAACAIPVYAASPSHRITELVPPGSFINVFGIGAEDASRHLQNFKPDYDFALLYLEAQQALADLFGDVSALWAERKRVVDAIADAFERLR